MEAAPPRKIGRYEIQQEIGRGTMGVVYQAYDPTLRRVLALKTISLAFAVEEADRQMFERRFLEEARAAAALSHPGIVVVFDVGMDAGTRSLYMALEHLRGRTLDSLLARGRALDWQVALGLCARVAEALHHAHSHGVVHRDVKPANIMVLASGDPKIMDFGVAKMEASQLTAGGRIFGSPSYMSPEQALGEKLDGRSDLFSLGSIVYEALTGRKAFAGPSVAAILMRVASEHPAPPSQVVDGLPRGVDEIVARAMAKSITDRYRTCQLLAQDLQDVLSGRPPRHALAPAAPEAERVTLAAPIAAAAAAAPRPPSGGRAGPDAEGTQVAGSGRGSLALPERKKVSLAFLAGPRQGEVLPLDRPRVVFGRAGAGRADIQIADPEISRAHAALECYGRQIVLRDLASTNGTFVDNQRIEEQQLEDRAEFRLGSSRVMLILTDPE